MPEEESEDNESYEGNYGPGLAKSLDFCILIFMLRQLYDTVLSSEPNVSAFSKHL